MAKKPKTTRPRGRPSIGGSNPTDEVILRGLATYYITGSVKTAAAEVGFVPTTIWKWARNREKIVKQAKSIANDYLDQKCAEMVELAYRGIVEKIDTSAKRKTASLEALNRIFGTAADKLIVIRELNKSTVRHEGEIGVSHKLMKQYILIKERAGKESIDDSKNRIKKHLD